MKINTNTWNKIRYTFITPIYDLIVFFLKESRKKSIESLENVDNSKVLIIGAGTGSDLEYLPDNCEIIATDITPAMVDRIIKKNSSLNKNVQVFVMDGQNLDFPDHSFDIVILHLILAVIPDPIACIKEAERLLKRKGQIIVFDKFVRKNTQVSLVRRFLNIFTNFMFSDITRRFESIVSSTKLLTITDERANFNGNFRRIKLIKH